MIVVDASAVVAMLLRLGKADALMERVLGQECVAAPELMDVEVVQ